MSIVTVKDLFTPVPQGWGVGAFNVNGLDDVLSITQAAEELDSPVILQVSESVARHVGVELVANVCRTAAKAVRVPVAIHLDHCHSADLAVNAMRHGFTSVMIDGSQLPFDGNVALTKQVVEIARHFGVSVEAELGLLGGREDDLVVESETLTNPEEAARFVELTGIDVFAPAIGTAHGFYKGEPKLDYDRLQQIRALVDIPMALHGGTGLTPEQLTELMRWGMAKINVGTELKFVYIEAMRKRLHDRPEEFEPRLVSVDAREAVKTTVKDRIRWFKSDGKASELSAAGGAGR